MVLLTKEVEGCNERGSEQPQQRVDVAYMGKFVGIGQITDIPGQEKVTRMVGRQGQVEGIPSGITGHDHALDIGLNHGNEVCLKM